jgi:ketosteroid isomerase-like protein
MSEGNVAIVQACMQAWQDGDFERSLSYFADDATWETGAVDTRVYCGPAGVARAVEEWIGAFDDYWLEGEGLIDLPGDRVLFMVREGGTGKTSGVPVEEEAALVFTLASGRIAAVRGYTDRSEAYADAGLPPP